MINAIRDQRPLGLRLRYFGNSERVNSNITFTNDERGRAQSAAPLRLDTPHQRVYAAAAKTARRSNQDFFVELFNSGSAAVISAFFAACTLRLPADQHLHHFPEAALLERARGFFLVALDLQAPRLGRHFDAECNRPASIIIWRRRLAKFGLREPRLLRRR
jgi:hypothetical protein